MLIILSSLIDWLVRLFVFSNYCCEASIVIVFVKHVYLVYARALLPVAGCEGCSQSTSQLVLNTETTEKKHKVSTDTGIYAKIVYMSGIGSQD